ncbi:MAG: hypothetical protein K2O18_16375 [Oscillospiraceae bacterium]|nr:hypothetical protein [Oscillospiraceae bacterium]
MRRAFSGGGFDALIAFILQIRDTVAGKQNQAKSVSAVISAGKWQSDETAVYPYYCDLAVEGVTAKDRAEVNFYPDGLETASACGFCQTNETLAGKIRIRAAGMPEKDIRAELWIEKGEE